VAVTFKRLKECIFDRLPEHIRGERSLNVFAEQRSKFEGWLKVAVCSSLIEGGFKGVVPEKDRIDVICDGWAIELKTTNTNYRYPSVVNKNRPITLNVQGVIDDIKQLRLSAKLNGINKAVLFVVFPVEHNKQEWQKHLVKITESLGNKIYYQEFKFKNNVPGVIYFGKIKDCI